MTTVGVKSWESQEWLANNWYVVPTTDREQARRIAFYFVHKRKPNDYAELERMTIALIARPIPPDVAEFITGVSR